MIYPSFRTLLFCGEVVTTGLLARCIKTLPWVQFVNLYSISEAHDVAYCDLTEWASEDGVKYIQYNSGSVELHHCNTVFKF